MASQWHADVVEADAGIKLAVASGIFLLVHLHRHR